MTGGKQVIAVDLDDVLAASIPAFVEFSNKKWGTKLTVEDYQENWMGMWGIDKATLIQRSDIIRSELWKSLEHSEEALPVLNGLARDYKLVITTSRRREMEKPTKDWINEYFHGIFEEIHHAGIFDKLRGEEAAKQTKAELYKQIGADYIIDDHPKHCLGADTAGIKAILFGDYPWNRNAKLPAGVIRLRTWGEVGEYFARRG